MELTHIPGGHEAFVDHKRRAQENLEKAKKLENSRFAKPVKYDLKRRG